MWIHASKRWDQTLVEFRRSVCAQIPPQFRPHRDDWCPISGNPPPIGCLLAVALLVDCIPTETLAGRLTRHELNVGDFGPCRFAWLYEDVIPLERPIPFRGGQRLFNVPDDVVLPTPNKKNPNR